MISLDILSDVSIVLIVLLPAWILFLFVQSLVINGIFISSTGETITLPDGSKKDGEMILYPIRKYLLQSTIRWVFYSGDQLLELIGKLENIFGPGFNPIDYPSDTLAIKLKTIDPDIKIHIHLGNVQYYKEVEDYRFSKYIRKPIIQCIICMASFWGFFTFWSVAYFLLGVNYFTIILWVVNTICLSYMNFLVYKKL